MHRIQVSQGDITRCSVDVIVNAAKPSLLGGGGVDGAIHRAAGPRLLEECRSLGGCEAGQAKITLGYRLPARHVIHTVGPIWHGGRTGEAEQLASCYRSSLSLAVLHQLRSIAFPAISCGAYGYPPELASRIAIDEVSKFLDQDGLLEQIYFVCFDPTVYQVFSRALGGARAA